MWALEDKQEKEIKTLTLNTMVESEMDQESSDPTSSLNSTTEQLCTKEAHLPSLGKTLLSIKGENCPDVFQGFFISLVLSYLW